MKRRITALALAFGLVLGTVAAAAGTEKTISVTPMTLTINGQAVTPTKSNGEAAQVFAYDGATYVPLRYLSELLGIEVQWDKNDPATAKLVSDKITLPAGGDGTYTGTASGFGGEVKAVITVVNGKITACTLTGDKETLGIGGAALETLQAQVLAAGSADIDGVAGATMTSSAVKNAVAAALAQATGAGKGTVKDGTYTASSTGFSWMGPVVCSVTFQNGKLTAIDVVEEHETYTGEMFHMVTGKYIPRLIENQSLATDAVAGATVSCSAVKSILTDAISQAGGNPADWNAPIAKSDKTVKLEGYDVVVVGMGGSGIMSFCAAADAGAKVFGIEKAGKLGGNSATTTGPMALNSKNMKDLYNNGKDYIDADAVYDTWMEYVETDEKEPVIRRAVYESGEALDYYIDKFGFDFQGRGGMLGSFVVPEWKMLWTAYTPDETGSNRLGPNKTYQFDRAVNKAIEMSPGSEYKLETTATKLLTDAKGNVTGVECVNVDGTTYQVYGKTVILATGGFIANQDMMMDTFGATTQTLGWTLCDGSGIKLGQSVGGATYALDVLPMIHIKQVPNMVKNDDLTADQKAILTALCLVNGETAVTIDGEAWNSATAEAYIPGFRYYVVYSQDKIDTYKEKGLTENFATATSHFMGQGGELKVGEPVKDMDTILSVGEKYGDVIAADSIAELAKGIGCDAATLSKTLGGKDGKYYAVACAGYAYATVGGLDVNENMNVLKTDGSVISNLFAVGQDSEGVCNVSGKAYSPWGGQAQSWTFVSGRIAGQQAAKVAGVK